MRSLFLSAAALAALITAQAAPAQIESTRSGSSSMTYVDEQEALESLGIFGTCYAGGHKAEALALIATEPGSRAEAKAYKEMFGKPYQSCLGFMTELNAPLALIRGAIAEGLYRRSVAVPLELRVSVPVSGAPIRTISEAARCYAAAHGDQVQALIANTKPGSKKEYQAVVTMMPDFLQCVPEKAKDLGFNATQVRFRLAEALLRMAPAVSSAGTK